MSIFKKLAEQFNAASKAPVAPRDNTVDIYHGTKVADPFRPLENLNSAETKKYVQQQNVRFANFIGQDAAQKEMAKFLSDVEDYARETMPRKHGKYYFSSFNDGKTKQPVYQVRRYLNDTPRILIDPNKLNKNGTTSLSGVFPSPSGKYLAYLTSEDGSDAQTLRVLDVKTGKHKRDVIHDCRFTSLMWDEDEKGFRYTYPAHDDMRRRVVKQHKLGKSAKRDPIIFEKKGVADSFVGVNRIYTTEGKFSGIECGIAGVGTNRWNEVMIKKGNGKFEPFFKDEKSSLSVLFVKGNHLYAVTDRDAPHSKLVKIDMRKPDVKNWETVIAEDPDKIMEGVYLRGGDLMVQWTADTASEITFHDLDGHYLRTMPLPPQSVVSLGSVLKKGKTMLVSVSGFAAAGDQYIYNFDENSLHLWKPSACPVNLKDAVIERHFATSKDGTKVPMTIIRRKDVKLDGTAATKLYGYGGFNVPLKPGFSFSTYNWVKEGGIYVQANLRGGGEFGAEWYNKGRLQNKQNVFDDFAACAEYLIKNKYTKPERLTINGGSNGGLLTLATSLQRPDLFGSVVSHVPVTDMYRFHKFTYGAAWKSDYGDIEGIKADFNAAAKYSPLHNVKKGAKYPPILVMTGANDDRVVPSHAYKFVATLNDRAPDTLGLLSVTPNAGHGAGKSKAQRIKEMVEEHAFLVKTLGPIDQKAYKIKIKNGRYKKTGNNPKKP